MTSTAEREVDASGLACPACGSSLSADRTELGCDGCGRGYSSVAGIPDLRLSYLDLPLDRDDDLAEARELFAHFGELDFLGLLRLHWRRSGKPSELAEWFISRALGDTERSGAYLAEIGRERGASLDSSDRFLEVGSGPAGLAAVAAGAAGTVFATDISMRWLVLAAKRLAEAGIDNVRLVACGAEDPPFPPDSFDVVAAGDVIEHAGRQDAFVTGCQRVLRPGGVLFLATPNRFSLSLEPHVRLWGVGFLPRRLAPLYVRAVRHAPYEHVRLLSSRALRRLLTRNGFEAKIVPPEIPPVTQRMYSGVELRLVRTYNRTRRLRPVRKLLLGVGPFFHVFGRKLGA
jgi:ubiquinone/menaquinone biosynthesis C-methylase UbiE